MHSNNLKFLEKNFKIFFYIISEKAKIEVRNTFTIFITKYLT